MSRLIGDSRSTVCIHRKASWASADNLASRQGKLGPPLAPKGVPSHLQPAHGKFSTPSEGAWKILGEPVDQQGTPNRFKISSFLCGFGSPFG